MVLTMVCGLPPSLSVVEFADDDNDLSVIADVVVSALTVLLALLLLPPPPLLFAFLLLLRPPPLDLVCVLIILYVHCFCCIYKLAGIE